MSGAIHAYGAACGINRRDFVLVFCVLATILTFLRIVRWAVNAQLLNLVFGTQLTPVMGCYGADCYTVFSCYGMKDSTFHIREPLVTLSGAFFFPLGIVGAVRGARWMVFVVTYYIAFLAALLLGIAIHDVAYVASCNAYSTNLVQTSLLFVSPITNAAKDSLKNMELFPKQAVDEIIGGFPVLAWYLIWAGLLTAVLAYVAWQASFFALLVERGPLGIGVHYGLNQWDEVVNHDEVKRLRCTEARSQFVLDGLLPKGSDGETSYGYTLPSAIYGSLSEDTRRDQFFLPTKAGVAMYEHLPKEMAGPTDLEGVPSLEADEAWESAREAMQDAALEKADEARSHAFLQGCESAEAEYAANVVYHSEIRRLDGCPPMQR